MWYVRQDIPSKGPDPGFAAAEKYILEYLDALNTDDFENLYELFGRPEDTSDIEDRLGLYGGLDLINVEVTIAQEFQYIYRVWISVLANDGSVIEMYEVIGWNGERWNMSRLYTGPPPPK